MSTHLWKYFFEDDVESFRRLVEINVSGNPGRNHIEGHGGRAVAVVGGPGAGLTVSPNASHKSRKIPEGKSVASLPRSRGSTTAANVVLTRAEVNAQDGFGVTLLHHIASSQRPSASLFASALLHLPYLDLYSQDAESGWTALHRALYFGNVTVARLLMERDMEDATGNIHYSVAHGAGGLIKIKDREGNSPFDVFGATTTSRNIRPDPHGLLSVDTGLEQEENETTDGVSGDTNESIPGRQHTTPQTCINGDELFMFGSNKNLNLGFPDEDDRQFPERIILKRADHLLRRLNAEYQSKIRGRIHQSTDEDSNPINFSSEALPALVRNQPILVQDVQLSKLHSAVLTTDPEANLYICGFGSGGRLGTGDEATRFQFVPICGGGLFGKKVVHIGLGLNHTLAISSEGEAYAWGSNVFGQLGISLPASNLIDEEPVQLLPRQIFGPLKRELVVGCAASRIHSIVHTATSLYTFGKNEGQLGLVDSDARSLAMQMTPRRVAASLFNSPICMVSAIEKATVCLLETHDVWIFANYGYTKLAFPAEGFSNHFLKNSYSATRYDSTQNHITKITSGGDTVCALSSMGDVWTVQINLKAENTLTSTSTTNPAKIRGALSQPQRVWSLKKGHMAVTDVDVGQDGSVIICTDSGSVWRRVKRAKIKDTDVSSSAEYKPKDYKFSRVPGLTRITAVRCNTFGAYAAIRRDCDVLKTQVHVESQTLWEDLFPLLSIKGLAGVEEDSDTENPIPRLWVPRTTGNNVATIRKAVLTVSDLEEQVSSLLAKQERSKESAYNIWMGTTSSKVHIPVHQSLVGGRSGVLRRALLTFQKTYFFSIPEVLTIEYDKDGHTLILFQGLDFITLINVVLYLYTDSLVDVWHHTRHAPALTFRYRQVRSELMRVAAHLDLKNLEQSARLMNQPPKVLHQDLERAVKESDYFLTGDLDVELDGQVMRVHSEILCQRCPFFEGLFNGRAAGLWLSSRRELASESEDIIKVDLKHIDPEIFKLVIRYIYADLGEEVYEEAVTADLDTFIDLVMEVMSVANELMLDRLTQDCQKMLGRFVNTRNVCQLLNAVAPCSVTEFKDAALEYICLNLEGMLENHYLDELDDDLMLELDEVVRQNQLACLPFAKSGRAEAELLENYPELTGIIERNKVIKIDSLALRSRLHEDEVRNGGSYRHRSLVATEQPPSPFSSKGRRILSMEGTYESRSPSLKAKTSSHDLMFELDDDNGETAQKKDSGVARSPKTAARYVHDEPHTSRSPTLPSSLVDQNTWSDAKHQALSVDPYTSLAVSPKSQISNLKNVRQISNHTSSPSSKTEAPFESTEAWRSSMFEAPRLGMKEIMAQASANRISNISSALSTQNMVGSPGGKISQRDRKKQQQQLQPQHTPPLPATQVAESSEPRKELVSPWQITPTGPKIALKDIIDKSKATPSKRNSNTLRRPSSPSLTLRQTISGSAQNRSVSNALTPNKSSNPQRSVSSPSIPHYATPPTSFDPPQRPAQPQHQPFSTPTPPIQSIRHAPPRAEPSLQLSMADILAQQQTEKEIIKEAAAKRSLQEIQEEQAFQEWWDQESRKVRAEEEAARTPGSKSEEEKGKWKGRGRGGMRGRGGKGRGGGSEGKRNE